MLAHRLRKAEAALNSNSNMPSRVEVAEILVLFGDHNWLIRPLDPEFRIIPANAALAFWGVEFINQVKCLCIIGQGDKSVRKALGYIHHAAVFSRQVGTKAMAERFRVRSQIDNHVVECATDTSDKLRLSFGGDLIVHAAQRALSDAKRVISLDEASD